MSTGALGNVVTCGATYTEILPVHECFRSIQGEGHYQGKAAFFIRLAGCDVGCHWCDVKESWTVDASGYWSVQYLAEQAAASGAQIAVITGGEPLLYDLTFLTAQLKSRGLKTHLETSGSSPLSGEWDWICLSPKKFKPPLPTIFTQANELKMIIFNKSDFLWAEENAAKVTVSCKRFLQPEWSREKKMLAEIVHYIKDHPQWELSLQIHKYLGLP
ncbi:MAG: 7-carboxy-7-deazaguanine synthase [Chitinophagales bacterium]|nr:MAG: 7-carboxy-7-deazaguanine synthase [Chitinophagales bacterium]